MYRHLIPIIGLALLGAACTQRNAVTLDGGSPVVDGAGPPAADASNPPPLDAGEAPQVDAGRPCTDNTHCATTEFCNLQQCGGVGRCTPRPTICPDYYTCPWACGCDGKSYCSACEAQQAGVNVAKAGPCMSCGELDAAYQAEVAQAKKCCPMCAALQCNQQVKDRLACGCTTFINIAPTPKMSELQQQWAVQGCGAKIKCAPSQCGNLQYGLCHTDGTCKDVLAD